MPVKPASEAAVVLGGRRRGELTCDLVHALELLAHLHAADAEGAKVVHRLEDLFWSQLKKMR